MTPKDASLTSTAASFARLAGHIGLIHLKILIAKPPFKDMKASFSMFFTFALVATVSASAMSMTVASGMFGSEAGMWRALVSLVIALAPLGLVAWIAGLRQYPSHLLAALFGCSTVVDLTDLALYLAGMTQTEVSVSSWVSKLLLGYMTWRAFQKEPEYVRSPSYGLKDGEF